MFFRIVLGAGALVVALIAFFLPSSPTQGPAVQGRNKTALFVSNVEHGMSNVLVATVSSLLENYPDVEVHYASFSGLRGKLKRVSSFARLKTPNSRDAIFHELDAPTYYEAIQSSGGSLETVVQPPASAGIDQVASNLQSWLLPWSVEHHMAIYDQVGALIEKIDPAVIVLDVTMRPAIDSTRDKNRVHAFVATGTVVDLFLGDQPYGSMFWKYPALSSGFKFPVPRRNILENIYLNFRMIRAVIMAPQISAKKSALKARGIKNTNYLMDRRRSDVPIISMNTEGASIPADVVPVNVTCAGPILLSVASASEQDPELTQWVKKTPTILINLGSGFKYSLSHTSAMVGALVKLLSKENVQVLWKFNKYGEYSDNVLSPLQPFLDSGRIRVSNWLTVDIMSLLETGGVVVSVHHGGSNCFHEAVAAGVAQVILPLWFDLYNFAALAEMAGIGVWACKETSPNWTVDGISNAIMEVMGGGQTNASLREKSKALGDKIKAGEKGRDISAKVIAQLTYIK